MHSTKAELNTLRASLVLPDDVFDMSIDRNMKTMNTTVRADLESKVADRLADEAASRVIARLASGAGMTVNRLGVLLEFLTHDEEIQKRFSAYLAARRILNDKSY